MAKQISRWLSGRHGGDVTRHPRPTIGPFIEVCLATFLIAAVTPQLRAQDGNPSAARRAALEEHIESFRLTLDYYGPEDKPFYRLFLHVDDRKPPTEPSIWSPQIRISPDAARKLIDGLDREGFLRRARPGECTTLDGRRQNYVLAVQNNHFAVHEVLGFEAEMVERLAALRKYIDDDAGKAMDRVIARLGGLRRAAAHE